MPPRGQGPRLWRRRARRDAQGRVTHPAVWIIRDGSHQESTGCGAADRGGAEIQLAAYITRKHVDEAAQGQRSPSETPVADVLAVYGRDVAGGHASPAATSAFIGALLDFFGEDTLSRINGARCRAYVKQRESESTARRELEVLRAAVNHYHKEGLVSAAVRVVLPKKRPPRDRWLTRQEAARLLLSAWRYRELQKGVATLRRPRRHVARFIVVGLYAGRRAGAIVEAALQPTAGRGWVDTERGVFHPRPRIVQTKKRQPAVPLPRRLVAHLRRWKRMGQRYVIEWNGEPISRMAKSFRQTVKAAQLDADVTPHTLRHTSATWMMQRGADPWAASGYLGMSLETLLRVYGHHHPEHLKGAWGVFDRPGGEAKSATGSATGTRGRKANKGGHGGAKTRVRRRSPS